MKVPSSCYTGPQQPQIWPITTTYVKVAHCKMVVCILRNMRVAPLHLYWQQCNSLSFILSSTPPRCFWFIQGDGCCCSTQNELLVKSLQFHTQTWTFITDYLKRTMAKPQPHNSCCFTERTREVNIATTHTHTLLPTKSQGICKQLEFLLLRIYRKVTQ